MLYASPSSSDIVLQLQENFTFRTHFSYALPVHCGTHLVANRPNHPAFPRTATCTAQAEAPVEKQVARWRQEVFKLLLSSRQAQVAHRQEAADQESAVARLEQRLKTGEDKAMLLEGRLLDRQVDLDLMSVKSNRAEAQLQELYRYLSFHTGR